MSRRFPGRQWRSNVVAMGNAGMSGPVEMRADVIPYQGRPAEWSYSSSSIAGSVGVPITPLAPVIASGSPYLWSIQPALPAGLSIDATTGTISGTPSAPSSSQLYLISARSRGGGNTVRLTISVA